MVTTQMTKRVVFALGLQQRANEANKSQKFKIYHALDEEIQGMSKEEKKLFDFWRNSSFDWIKTLKNWH